MRTFMSADNIMRQILTMVDDEMPPLAPADGEESAEQASQTDPDPLFMPAGGGLLQLIVDALGPPPPEGARPDLGDTEGDNGPPSIIDILFLMGPEERRQPGSDSPVPPPLRERMDAITQSFLSRGEPTRSGVRMPQRQQQSGQLSGTEGRNVIVLDDEDDATGEDQEWRNPHPFVDSLERILSALLFMGLRGTAVHTQGQPPASAAVIAALPIISSGDKQLRKHKECLICQDDFQQQETRDVPTDASTSESDILKLPCRHLYHRGCIVKWLHTSGTCPACRYELETDSEDYNAGVRERMAERDRVIRVEDEADKGDHGVNQSQGTNNQINSERDNTRIAGKKRAHDDDEVTDDGDCLRPGESVPPLERKEVGSPTAHGVKRAHSPEFQIRGAAKMARRDVGSDGGGGDL
ncbi:hypothetical protein HK097_000041 [Rhizophlyctis rosea]|uniref:RING-type domain-containing protein n=1 Tax=Rhizophlyctis rosea TaxID=64517 RepID=A0AAD5XAJ2_9FUNG|nr:hypothetical protein HK097_000041 [Rhizophlyctis rosea]